jgi:hypothetical protein
MVIKKAEFSKIYSKDEPLEIDLIRYRFVLSSPVINIADA